MAKLPACYYWDASVFIAYLQKEPERYPSALAQYEYASKAGLQIATSTISIAEAAYIENERRGIAPRKRLRPGAETLIDEFWNNQIILPVEPSLNIMRRARSVIREAGARGWSIRSADAVHLATAISLISDAKRNVLGYYLYDDRLATKAPMYRELVGVEVGEPKAAQYALELIEAETSMEEDVDLDF